MSETGVPNRILPDRLHSRGYQLLRSWEALLLLVAVGIFVLNSFASPYFLSAWNLSDATFNFTEKAMIAFAMALLIISGEIDLSVASIIALAHRAKRRTAVWRVQRLFCHRSWLALYRGHHWHHEPVSRR